jgi:CRISPR-associated endonuclease Cas2
VARRRYLVAYDIRDDRRLRLVAGCMEGYGSRVQYSVSCATSRIGSESLCAETWKR